MPRETAGKVIGSILMLGGLSLLSIITAMITSAFVARRRAEMQAAGEDPVLRQLDQIAARLGRIEAEFHRPGHDAGATGSGRKDSK